MSKVPASSNKIIMPNNNVNIGSQSQRWSTVFVDESPFDMVKKSALDEVEERLAQAKQYVKDLEVVAKEAKKMKFKEGDIVYHPNLGNCIVQDVFIKGDKSPYRLGPPEEIQKIGGYAVAHKNGVSTVPQNELVPPTELAKKLYGEKQNEK